MKTNVSKSGRGKTGESCESVTGKTGMKNSAKDKPAGNAWVCKKCGNVDYSEEAPEKCPYCLYPHRSFEKVE